MAISLVTHTHVGPWNGFTSGATSPSFTSTSGGGNLAIAAGAIGGSGSVSTITSITDNLGVAWTVRQNPAGGGTQNAFVAYRENCPSGVTSLTFVFSGGGGVSYSTFDLSEWSGLLTSAAEDQRNTGTGDMSAGAVSTGSITTTQADELLICSGGSDESSSSSWGSIGGSGTWTELFQYGDTTTGDASQSGYQIVSSISTYNATLRYLNSTNVFDVTNIVSFKAAAPPAAGVTLAGLTA